MEQPTQRRTQPTPAPEAGASIWQYMVYGLSIVGGAYAASKQAWAEYYSTIKHTVGFDALYAERLNKRTDLAERAAQKLVTPKEYLSQFHTIETDYTKQINSKLLHDYGVESEGVTGMLKGTFQRFRRISHYKQADIAFTTAAPMAIAIGGVYLLSQNRRLHHKLNALDDQIEAQQPTHAQR